MIGNAVKFAYIASGSSLPSSYPDADTIYFLEEAKEIRVGSQTLANVDLEAIDMATLASVLEAYTIKSIEVAGTGDTVADVSFNAANGRITVTKGMLPVLSKGAAPIPLEPPQLSPGSTFDVVTDTSVSGHTITDGKTRFKLPDQINSIRVAKSGEKNIVFTLIYTNGNTVDITYDGFGTAAFNAASDFATAAQGIKADNAMPADGGSATNATIMLRADPQNAMEAATKQYVDRAVEGASSNLRFLGVTTTPVTDGGSESPTIDGQIIPTSELQLGDWVIYQNIQYIWDETKWVAYGGSAHSVPDTRKVSAGYGLLVTNEGILNADIMISHDTKFDEDHRDRPASNLELVYVLEYDKAGHISAAEKRDITNDINSLISSSVSPIEASLEALESSLQTDYYTKGQVDSQISSAVQAAVDDIPEMIDEAIDDKISTDTEFNEMMHEVFP